MVILPLAAYTGDQGLGVGLDAFLSGIAGTNWSLRGTGFYSFNYQTSFVGVGLTNPRLLDLLYVSTRLNSVTTKRALFYGFENTSQLHDPSQYSLNMYRGEIKLGVYVLEQLVAGLGYTVASSHIGQGEREEEVQFQTRYQGRPYLTGADIGAYQLFLKFDNRDSELSPTEGTVITAEWDKGMRAGDREPDYERTFASAVHIIQLVSTDLLLVTRAKHERVWGGDVPFNFQSRLGGMNSIRGYRGGRWTDSASILYGAESRWSFWEPGGWFKRMELSLGYEVGRVYNNGALNVLFDDLRPSYIVGLTGILQQDIPLRLDFATSPEGNQVYVHLLYPF